MSGFAKIWAFKWLENFIVSYFFSRASLDEVLDVKTREIGAIISLKTLDPALDILRKTREKRAKPLLDFIENLDKGEKSG
jgi:hypothetical protein